MNILVYLGGEVTDCGFSVKCVQSWKSRDCC